MIIYDLPNFHTSNTIHYITLPHFQTTPQLLRISAGTPMRRSDQVQSEASDQMLDATAIACRGSAANPSRGDYQPYQPAIIWASTS